MPWASALHFTRHLHTITNRATGVLWNIFFLLAWDSTLTQSNKLTPYKLFIRSILTYAVPVWSFTCSFNYFRLPAVQSECLRFIGNHPMLTPTFHLHYTLNIEPISIMIHRLSQIFCSLPLTPQPPSPTNRELYCSQLDKRTGNIHINNRSVYFYN